MWGQFAWDMNSSTDGQWLESRVKRVFWRAMNWANLVGAWETIRPLIRMLIKFAQDWFECLLIEFKNRWPFCIRSQAYFPHLSPKFYIISQLLPFFVISKIFCWNKSLGCFGIDCDSTLVKIISYSINFYFTAEDSALILHLELS